VSRRRSLGSGDWSRDDVKAWMIQQFMLHGGVMTNHVLSEAAARLGIDVPSAGKTWKRELDAMRKEFSLWRLPERLRLSFLTVGDLATGYSLCRELLPPFPIVLDRLSERSIRDPAVRGLLARSKEAGRRRCAWCSSEAIAIRS
jgi:hypothetical protein